KDYINKLIILYDCRARQLTSCCRTRCRAPADRPARPAPCQALRLFLNEKYFRARFMKGLITGGSMSSATSLSFSRMGICCGHTSSHLPHCLHCEAYEGFPLIRPPAKAMYCHWALLALKECFAL